jgi:hypothetical protein
MLTLAALIPTRSFSALSSERSERYATWRGQRGTQFPSGNCQAVGLATKLSDRLTRSVRLGPTDT